MKANGLVRALVIASIFSVSLYIVRVLAYDSLDFWYLNWNLLLAALPLIFGWWLFKRLKTSLWSNGWNLLLTALWLGFLPNSFYLVTDFIHLGEISQQSLVFDAVLIMVFAVTGLMMGYTSVVMMHRRLRQRLGGIRADSVIVGIFTLCSFAIYLGRYMRWNTWDILINPAGLLFDVSDSLVNPRSSGQVWTTTLLFLAYIGVIYLAILQFVSLEASTSGKKPTKRLK